MNDEPKSAAELKEIRLHRKLTQDAEGIKAMAEIAASDIAIRKRTEKLRAIRLAKEAADRDNPPADLKTKPGQARKRADLNDERNRIAPRRRRPGYKAAQDARSGKADRDAATKAVPDNMAKLKALRLAREAAEPPRAPPPRSKRPAPSQRSQAKKGPALADWLASQQSGGRADLFARDWSGRGLRRARPFDHRSRLGLGVVDLHLQHLELVLQRHAGLFGGFDGSWCDLNDRPPPASIRGRRLVGANDFARLLFFGLDAWLLHAWLHVCAPFDSIRKKGKKIRVASANMPSNRGDIEVMHHSEWHQINAVRSGEKEPYGRNWQEERASEKGRRQVKEAEATPVEDDDYEDGDFATPKRDRDGNDDEPL